MQEIQIQKPEIIFANAILQENKEALLLLLSDNGKFSVQNETFETLEVGKEKFIEWIMDKRGKESSLFFYFDQCVFCRIGNPVVIFNNGNFPIIPKDSSEKEKAGLMFVIEEDKITQIDFCYSFLETDNRYIFEKNIEDKFSGYMKLKNCTREQAEQDLKDNPFLFCDFD